jgi:cytochrome b subunit of formate dehydrogenase
MSDRKFRRFSGFHIAFHWIVAIPYVLLLLSGALLILHRLQLLDFIPFRVLSLVHRWVGIILLFLLFQLLIAGWVGGYLKLILRDLRDWFTVRLHDILWMMLVPLHVLFPSRVHLPPVGRFNAGQKTHGLFIVLAIGTFGVTGILIMLRPADMRPWLIHSWLFFGALGFLCIHLFLGLINPPTRKALPGIFTGMVPLQYVHEHHPLVVFKPHAVPQRPHAVVSKLAVAITAILAIGLAAGAAWHFGPRRVRARAMTIAKQEHPLISPGPLAAAHANDPRTARCEVCHEAMKPPSNQACLACHQDIGGMMQNKSGFHGTLQGECRTCHEDHRGRDVDLRPLNLATFNHKQARFTLEDKHQTLQCDQCHVDHSPQPGERRFVGLKFQACTDCHTSPHESAAPANCKQCHTERGWTGRELVFSHQRDTNFPLQGKHATVDCNQCHSPSRAQLVLASSTSVLHQVKSLPDLRPTTQEAAKFRLTAVGSQCADCHVDPHAPSLGSSCEQCHSPSGWTGRYLKFNHNTQTHFALIGQHAQVECVKCHQPVAPQAALAQAPFAQAPTDCERCHQEPHAGQFADASCTSCHNEQGWKGKFLLFDHNRDAPFKIDALHSGVQCAACHVPSGGAIQYRSTPTTCQQCHAPIASALAGTIAGGVKIAPDPHSGRIQCIDCHNPAARAQLAVDFADRCVNCHTPRYRDLFFSWEQSLSDHTAEAKRKLASMKDTDPQAAQALQHRIDAAKEIGFHNINAAIKVLDQN